jgi:hypothetical protein
VKHVHTKHYKNVRKRFLGRCRSIFFLLLCRNTVNFQADPKVNLQYEYMIINENFGLICALVYGGSWTKPLLTLLYSRCECECALSERETFIFLSCMSGIPKITKPESYMHGLINYTDTKAKCRHLKKITCKGILRQVFIRVYREIQSVMLVFLTQLCELLPLLPSLWLNPPPPSLCQSTEVQTVCGCEGVGVLSPVGDHILQEFNTLYLTRFRIYKIAMPPQTKKPCRKVSYR